MKPDSLHSLSMAYTIYMSGTAAICKTNWQSRDSHSLRKHSDKLTNGFRSGNLLLVHDVESKEYSYQIKCDVTQQRSLHYLERFSYDDSTRHNSCHKHPSTWVIQSQPLKFDKENARISDVHVSACSSSSPYINQQTQNQSAWYSSICRCYDF